jgi:hypothetical protein
LRASCRTAAKANDQAAGKSYNQRDCFRFSVVAEFEIIALVLGGR